MFDQALTTSRRAFVAGLAATTATLASQATTFAAAKRRAAAVTTPVDTLLADFAELAFVFAVGVGSAHGFRGFGLRISRSDP